MKVVSDNTGTKLMSGKMFVWLLATVLLTTVSFVEPQQPKNLPRIGYLTNSPMSADSVSRDAFRRGLRELGYVEGKDIVFEWRSGERSRDRQRAFAAELVRLKVTVIVAGGSGDIRAAKEA